MRLKVQFHAGRLQLLLLEEESTFSLCLHWLRQSWSFMASWISLITQVKINCVPHQPQFLNSYYSWCEWTAINVQTGWNNWWLHFGSRQSWNNTSVMKYQISSIRYDFSATYVFFTVGPIFIGTAEKKFTIPILEAKNYFKENNSMVIFPPVFFSKWIIFIKIFLGLL